MNMQKAKAYSIHELYAVDCNQWVAFGHIPGELNNFAEYPPITKKDCERIHRDKTRQGGRVKFVPVYKRWFIDQTDEGLYYLNVDGQFVTLC